MLGLDRDYRKYWILGVNYDKVSVQVANSCKWIALKTPEELRALIRSVGVHGRVCWVSKG